MKLFKRTLSLILALLLVFSMVACNKQVDDAPSEPSGGDVTGETASHDAAEEVTLNLWYTESYMQDFLTSAITKFMEENPNVKINLKLSAEAGYLENINANSIKKTDVVDVYVLQEDDLEQAYLAGLALEYEPAETVYTDENFCDTALSAVTYDNKRVAYPLCFDSAFLVYNRAYTTEAPATFDELLDFANNFQVEDGNAAGAQLERVLSWNISDVKMNYQFLSDSFNVGGENGDDRNKVTVYHANVIKGMEYFKSLNDFFALDRTTITDEEVVEYFVSGKAAFTITNTTGLTTLHTAGMDFSVCPMPDITSSLSSSPLSTTQTLVVNPYSDNIEVAQKLVNALSYDYADEFYVKTGFFPSRYTWNYDSEMVKGVYANYDDSVSRPKMMNLGDFYVRLEIFLHNIWDDAGETETMLMEFQEYVKEQLKR